jgi:hypothetical protein
MAVQAAGLHRFFPLGRITVNRKVVSWLGKIIPHEYGRTYTIELLYRKNESPKVWVREPDLKELANGRRLPHVYDQTTRELCLYLPGCGFWSADKSVASTMMLWACLWLFYFELWLVTNEWHGRGVHPGPEGIAA